jgi:ABC-2 type transport system permease protein
MMIFTIAAKELRSLFLSPLAWVILAVVQFIIAYFFIIYIEQFMSFQTGFSQFQTPPGVAEAVLAPVFDTAGVVILLVTPILTMRLISEEIRGQTLPLIFSAPISMTEIILGKYLGILTFMLVILVTIMLMPISLLFGTSLDMGQFLAGLIGLVLLVASYAAIGLFMSSLTDQPTIAGVSTFGVLLLLWILDAATTTGTTSGEIFSYLSILRHYQSLLKGVFNSSDVLYYILFVTLFLVLSIRRLDSYRLQH